MGGPSTRPSRLCAKKQSTPQKVLRELAKGDSRTPAEEESQEMSGDEATVHERKRKSKDRKKDKSLKRSKSKDETPDSQAGSSQLDSQSLASVLPIKRYPTQVQRVMQYHLFQPEHLVNFFYATHTSKNHLHITFT